MRREGASHYICERPHPLKLSFSLKCRQEPNVTGLNPASRRPASCRSQQPYRDLLVAPYQKPKISDVVDDNFIQNYIGEFERSTACLQNTTPHPFRQQKIFVSKAKNGEHCLGTIRAWRVRQLGKLLVFDRQTKTTKTLSSLFSIDSEPPKLDVNDANRTRALESSTCTSEFRTSVRFARRCSSDFNASRFSSA
jgi:hypothetical protein